MRHLILLTILLISWNVKGADIAYEGGEISIEGEIVEGDYARLLSAIQEESKYLPYLMQFDCIRAGKSEEECAEVIINSPKWHKVGDIYIQSSGGDVYEAMKLGRLIREKKYGVAVAGKCYSSCVYLLAAGLTRVAFTSDAHNILPVGIHRPYFTVTQGENTDAMMKQILYDSREYFKEMNINPSLADDMFSIAPENTKLLNKDDLINYRLNQIDMAYKERLETDAANRYGMTRAEFMEAKKEFIEDTKKYCGIDELVDAFVKHNGDAIRDLSNEYEECVDNFRYKHGLFKKEK